MVKCLSKYTKQEQAQLKAAALLLRFRSEAPTSASPKYVAYSTIAKILSLSYNTVQHICR